MLARCQELQLSGSLEGGEQTEPICLQWGSLVMKMCNACQNGGRTLSLGNGVSGSSEELTALSPTEWCLISCEPHYTPPGMSVFGSRSPSQASKQWSRRLTHPLVLYSVITATAWWL